MTRITTFINATKTFSDRALAAVLALATLLATQASAFGDTGAQNKTNPGAGAAVVIAIICFRARKGPIGGWLLYYYISLYAGLAASLLLVGGTLQNYSPERWQNRELYALAIASTALSQLLLITQSVVATILVMWREWKWVRLLRAILVADLIWTAISIALDSKFFSADYVALDCLALVWLAIWLAYFFRSERVKRVFLSKDWSSATPTSPPVQIPSVTQDTSLASVAASKSDRFSPRKTRTPALIFSLCAVVFCVVVILFFRPWEQHQASRQETYNPTKPLAGPIQPGDAGRTKHRDIFDELAEKMPTPSEDAGRTKQQPTPPPQIDFSSLPDQLNTSPLTPAEIARRAFPSVVLLSMQDARGQPISLGSGFFIDKDVVATNFHVIEGAAAGYAKVIGQSAKLNIKGTVAVDALHDLALLQVDSSSVPYLLVAPKLSVTIGDAIYAIGNPQGLEGTFSQGIVSSVRALGSDRILQITAPISPGSSGGPVLDQTGNVVGVSFASIENGQNLNFAIPSNYVATLQAAKRQIRPLFDSIPRAKLHTTLLGRIGNERPLTGVVGENFMYDPGMGFTSGEFSFSLHNKLAQDIGKVYGFIVFHDPEGQPLDTVPIKYGGTIPAHTAKRITGAVDGSVRRLSESFWLWDNRSHVWRQFTGNSKEDEQIAKRSTKTETRKGKVEFRILDFTVD